MSDNPEVRLALVEQNYQNLDKRMGSVETKLDQLHTDIKNNNSGLIKAIIGGTATIVASCLSIVIVLMMKF